MGTEIKPRYRKRLRAEQEAQTRQRITEAAVRLHGTVGPANTTIAGIAKAAGVQRATVYRHFRDEEAIFDACTAHFYARHPLPDPARWEEIRDPDERLRAALAAIYAFYGAAAPMLSKTQRDRDHVPPKARAAFLGYFELIHGTLMRGRRERGRRRARVAAAIGHAIAFATWVSLVETGGLADEDAIDLVAGMVASA
ncbi:MAG: helix-turn-helix domain-containing protein [Solirubrobacterales bacterium]